MLLDCWESSVTFAVIFVATFGVIFAVTFAATFAMIFVATFAATFAMTCAVTFAVSSRLVYVPRPDRWSSQSSSVCDEQ